jgi:hypothetical protein
LHGALRASLSIAASLLFFGSAARAGGRYPATNALVVSPADANVLVLRTTFGLLVSRDAGKTWNWICGSAMGTGGNEDPAMAVTKGGALLGGMSAGLSISPDTGCSWHLAPELTGWAAVDVAVRADDPRRALSLAVSTPASRGAVPAKSRIFATEDDGAHWAPLGAPLDPSTSFQAVGVAPSDPRRIYASGRSSKREPGAGDVSLLALLALSVSDDAAATWVERPMPADARTETSAYVAAVDPYDADRVYVRTSPVARLYVSEDAGRTFHAVLSFRGEMQGFALSPSGQTIYVGGPADGLWVADARRPVFQRISEMAVQCLAVSGDTLYACSDDQSFALGASNNGGASFEPLLRLAAVRGALACPPSTETAACAAEFASLCKTLGDCPSDAASVSPVSSAAVAAAAGAEAGAGAVRSCACSAPGANEAQDRSRSLFVSAVLLVSALRCRSVCRKTSSREPPRAGARPPSEYASY